MTALLRELRCSGGAGQTAGFSTADPSLIYLPVDMTPGRPEVAAQENDPSSMLNYTKGLLSLRASITALGNMGDWKLVSDPYEPYPVVYERSHGDERYLVVLNPRERPAEVSVEGYEGLQVIYGDPQALKVSRQKGLTRLKIRGVTSVICKIQNN